MVKNVRRQDAEGDADLSLADSSQLCRVLLATHKTSLHSNSAHTFIFSLKWLRDKQDRARSSRTSVSLSCSRTSDSSTNQQPSSRVQEAVKYFITEQTQQVHAAVASCPLNMTDALSFSALSTSALDLRVNKEHTSGQLATASDS